MVCGPQEALNTQLVDDADIVIGLFWHRLGSPTGDAESGTVEEVERGHENGAYAAILSSTRDIPPADLDTDQLERLKTYYADVRSRALVLPYADEADLSRHVDAILHAAVSATRATRETETESRLNVLGTGAEVWPRFESYGRGHRLVLSNTGPEPALNVRHRLEAENEGDRLPLEVDGDAEIESLAPGGDVGFLISLAMGMSPQFRCVVQWTDSAGEHENAATLRVF